MEDIQTFLFKIFIKSLGCLVAFCFGELCYRLWLIYDKKELKKNNLECGISSEEMKMGKVFGVTCVGLVMLFLHQKIEPVWLIVAVIWLHMRIIQVTDSLSDVNDILEQRNSGIGQGRAKSYMEGFLDNRMSARPEKAVGEGSTIIGDKLNTYYENRLSLIQPENERYECRNEFVIFLPIDPNITKIVQLKNQNLNLSVFRCVSDSIFEIDIQLDDTGSIRKSVCWIFKRREDEDRYWASEGRDTSGDKVYFVGDIPSELPRDMRLAEREEERIGITRSFKKIIADSYKRKVLLFDVGHSWTKQSLSEMMRKKFAEVS